MLSNDDYDGRKALGHILFSSAIGAVVPVSMSYVGLLNPLFLPVYYGAFLRELRAVKEFADSPNEQSAKRVKIESYAPFLVLLIGIYLSVIYDRVNNKANPSSYK